MSRKTKLLEERQQILDSQLKTLTNKLNKELAPLGELFGRVRSLARELHTDFETSLTHPNFQDRGDFLVELSQESQVPTSGQLESFGLRFSVT